MTRLTFKAGQAEAQCTGESHCVLRYSEELSRCGRACVRARGCARVWLIELAHAGKK